MFKIGEDRTSQPAKMEVYASFGGLLMLLKVRHAVRSDLVRWLTHAPHRASPVR